MNHTPHPQLHASIVALTVALLCTGLVACGASNKEADGKAASTQGTSATPETSAEAKHEEGDGLRLSDDEAKRAGLQVQTLQPSSQADVVTVTATIKANQDRIAQVAPRVEGRITQVSANLGDNVRAGQVLATLDSVALGEAQSALQQAQSAHRVAQADFQRAQTLSAEEIIPQRELLRAKAEFEKASSELRATEDKLRLLGASPQRGGRAESNFLLTAPLAGTVIQKKAAVGELASASEPVFTVADLSIVWIEASLTEDLLAKVRKGASATVTVSAYPGQTFAGKVTYIAGVLDKDSRTIPARIEVDNKDGRLKPEMFASAIIETGQAQADVLSVPEAAVVLLQGQPTVFVSEHGGYEARPVELGDKVGGRTTIRAGLLAGDKVVTVGAYALKARLLKSQISAE
ncbi:efflux RND transporter periplasmic adaptor subunit [Aquabacterium sp. CECT 9606]|uniref:efflux RND transporter periplasmic adaptor subunit n=1 Tax=Aquabacterium sp. CECT 9606 TaxID=2845822 RepID=UPI001E36E6A9|nr:efflux RND transporter periplasmic adaptor subunit [Aquabacterium sp. CECT 9606]CAH0353423.1 Cobalt-zinc-cadmium resistance protein CzcB [Aquabacterium sp. CECT 9606]